MKEFVLDRSATLPWSFASEATRATDALHDSLVEGGRGWAPALWHLGLANLMLCAQHRGRIDQAGIQQFLATLNLYDIEVDAETMGVAWTRTLALAESNGLSVYDATYLELALRKGLPLASLDQPLCQALKRAGGKLAL